MRTCPHKIGFRTPPIAKRDASLFAAVLVSALSLGIQSRAIALPLGSSSGSITITLPGGITVLEGPHLSASSSAVVDNKFLYGNPGITTEWGSAWATARGDSSQLILTSFAEMTGPFDVDRAEFRTWIVGNAEAWLSLSASESGTYSILMVNNGCSVQANDVPVAADFFKVESGFAARDANGALPPFGTSSGIDYFRGVLGRQWFALETYEWKVQLEAGRKYQVHFFQSSIVRAEEVTDAGSTLALLGLGLGGLAVTARRRKS